MKVDQAAIGRLAEEIAEVAGRDPFETLSAHPGNNGGNRAPAVDGGESDSGQGIEPQDREIGAGRANPIAEDTARSPGEFALEAAPPDVIHERHGIELELAQCEATADRGDPAPVLSPGDGGAVITGASARGSRRISHSASS